MKNKRRKIAIVAAAWVLLGLVMAGTASLLQSCGDGGRNLMQLRRQAAEMSLREMAGRRMHHGPEGFINPFLPEKETGFGRLLKWKLLSENKFKKYYPEEKVRVSNTDWDAVRSFAGLSVTFIKHSSVMIKDRDKYLLVDPVFDQILFFIKDFSPLGYPLSEMPRPDHVLITHGHRDHLDEDSLGRLDRETHVISPLGYDEVFSGLKMTNRTKLDWFESYREGGLEVTLIPANHWTLRNPLEGPNTSLWGGYIIKTVSGPTIFISGDSGYMSGLDELGREYDIDLAIFYLGAYEPRWFMRAGHMNPAETVRSFQDLGAKRLMAVHWGAFRLGDEPVHFPPLDLKREMEEKGLADRLVHLEPGGTFFF